MFNSGLLLKARVKLLIFSEAGMVRLVINYSFSFFVDISQQLQEQHGVSFTAKGRNSPLVYTLFADSAVCTCYSREESAHAGSPFLCQQQAVSLTVTRRFFYRKWWLHLFFFP